MAREERLSPYATPSATRAVLERHGLFAKYSLGQNFLVNDDIVRKIVELADVGPADHVLEVGPGIGTLTAALLQRAGRVTAVEMDHDLPAVLADTLSPWAERFTLMHMDALDVREADFAAGAEQASAQFDCESRNVRAAELATGRDAVHAVEKGPAQAVEIACPHSACPGAAERATAGALPNKLVSNLPYAVAATVVLDYLQRFHFLESATVMVQKEVADRMMAKPGTKAYGAYTVKLSLYAQPAGRFPVSPGNFFPPPRVESAVIRLNRASVRADDGHVLLPGELRAACRMADAAFATRRKTLANSCKTYFASEPEVQAELSRIFERATVDPARRGETLAQQDFIRLGLSFLEARAEA